MDRSDILELMAKLKLFGMRAAYDELMATAIKRQYEPARIIGELLAAEIAEKQARSIKYQMTIAKLPLAKDLDGFTFAETPINESLVRSLATGAFLAEQRNAVLVGGTGSGKSHLAMAIARSCIRGGARGRFYIVLDLVNRLESEARAGRQGRLADYLTGAISEQAFGPVVPLSDQKLTVGANGGIAGRGQRERDRHLWDLI